MDSLKITKESFLPKSPIDLIDSYISLLMCFSLSGVDNCVSLILNGQTYMLS